jgi:tetratricopeptide (TPR) repeat protein
VLPFRNLNADAEMAYLSGGLADDIAVRLSYEPQWAVRFSGGWMRSYDPNPAPTQAARELHSQLILTGSFAKEKDKLIFVGEMVRMPDGAPVWSGKLNAGLDDGLAAVPELVAEQIAAAIHQVPRRMTATRSEAAASKKNAEAYRLYLRGLDAARRSGNRSAMQWSEKALAADPELAPAMTLLAYSAIGDAYESTAAAKPPALDRAMKLYREALKRNAASPAHLSISGQFLMELGRLDDSVELLRSAIRLNPNHAEAYLWLSQAYRYAGVLRESAEQAETALRLDPAVREISTINTYLYLGEYDRFLQTLPQAHLNARAFFYRGLAYYSKRDFPRAEAEFTRAIELEPRLLHARYGQALRHAIRGEKQKGLDLLRQLEASGHPDGEMRYKLAQAYAALGDRTAALRALRSAVEAKFICHECFARDPLLEKLRSDAGIQVILRKAQEEQEAFRKKFF